MQEKIGRSGVGRAERGRQALIESFSDFICFSRSVSRSTKNLSLRDCVEVIGNNDVTFSLEGSLV